jgi:hypothetical protein
MVGMTTTTTNAADVICDAVMAWDGVHADWGSRGELSLKHGKRELGHLHGDRVLHIGFPKATWHELHDAGRIDYHPVFPGKPGFASRALRTDADVQDAIALLRINYERSSSH